MSAKDILAAALFVDAADIPAEAALDNFPPWDSLAHMRLIEEIEMRTGTALTTDEMLAIQDIPSIEALLRTRK